MHRFLIAAAALAWTTAASAEAPPRATLGTLTCTLAASGEKQDMPPGEERAMRCAFKPAESGAEHVYTGTIRKVGAGEQLQGKLVLIWVVQGPANTKLTPGLIAQTYVGGSRGQGASKGAASQGLVGERNSEIIMRPETPHAGADTGPAVTVIELKLETIPA